MSSGDLPRRFQTAPLRERFSKRSVCLEHPNRSGRRLAYGLGMNKHIISTTITAVAVAGMFACNKETPNNTQTAPPMNQTPIARNAPAERQDVNSPITVTGCLQKEGALMTTYIVTGINEPSQKNV